jgi:hypothetical protein
VSTKSRREEFGLSCPIKTGSVGSLAEFHLENSRDLDNLDLGNRVNPLCRQKNLDWKANSQELVGLALIGLGENSLEVNNLVMENRVVDNSAEVSFPQNSEVNLESVGSQKDLPEDWQKCWEG